MLSATSERALVYQVLDNALGDTVAPPGTHRAICSVIDSMRARGANVEEVRRAESVSVGLHKLGWALQRSDADEVKQAREKLKLITVELLNSRIQTNPHLQ